MNHSLNPTFESFYKSILDYAGIEYKDGIFVNKDERIGEISIENKHLTLPYFENLKNPNGRLVFHLLNENYTNPENTVFNLFKKRLTLELNLKLTTLVVSLIALGSDVQLQQRIKSSKLIELVSGMGELDHSLIEAFLGLVKSSKKTNAESYIFDIFLRKNGEINDVPYAAIGKINFQMYNEIVRGLEDPSKEYRAYGSKFRKKDLLGFMNVFKVIFPQIDERDVYVEGTDNKIFRYLNILLKTSFLVSERINEIADLLKDLNEPSLSVDDMYSNLDWIQDLEKLYGMATDIRLIPSQVDVSIEPSRIRVDETKAKADAPKQATAPTFNPTQVAPQPAQQAPLYANQQPTPQPTQPQQPRQLTPEEIIRGGIQQPVYQQPMQNFNMLQPQPPMPLWMQQEMMARGQMPQQQMPMQQMPMQQPMIPQQGFMQQYPMYAPQQIPMQGQMFPQQGFPQPFIQQQPMNTGLQVNPHFFNRTAAPFN